MLNSFEMQNRGVWNFIRICLSKLVGVVNIYRRYIVETFETLNLIKNLQSLPIVVLISKYGRFSVRTITRKETYRHVVEFVWTILPAVILVVIAVPSVRLLYFMDYYIITNDPICTFKIIGHQWFWSYEYFALSSDVLISDIFNDSFSLFEELAISSSLNISVEFDSYMVDEETVNSRFGGLRLLEVDNPLFVPINVCIRFLITSVDVLHAWAVPSLGVKVDAVPGRLNQIYAIVKRPGNFYGQCSEICGVNHGFMPIKVVAIDQYTCIGGTTEFLTDEVC